MRRALAAVLAAGLVLMSPVHPGAAFGQSRPRRPAPKPPPAKPLTAPADVTCPTPLGKGIKTGWVYCDVMAGREPAAGVVVKLPSRRGSATLLFDLHNRHMYSAEQERGGRAFARATATIGVLTMDSTLLARAVVRTEFRRAADLLDRIGGGAGPGGVKAVAPIGNEPIAVEIPEKLEAVSILGERLTVATADGQETYASPGRPIALVSNIRVEYRPVR
jgi:hypothetical protein